MFRSFFSNGKGRSLTARAESNNVDLIPGSVEETEIDALGDLGQTSQTEQRTYPTPKKLTLVVSISSSECSSK